MKGVPTWKAPRTGLQQWFAPVRASRVVVSDRVACPVRNRAVDLDRCLDCALLVQAVRDEDGAVTHVVCKPTPALTYWQ